ncbi:MAG: MATE family efflux transporter [Spirochaetaceae bacterium]|nr:MAG: MATE family efflux transporter [Spirochaetaceae bacterium]
MLAQGRIGRTLFSLSAPAIAGMLVMAIYNMVDTFFVSLLRDTTAIAATGIVFPLFQLIGAVGLTFGMGAASVVSRRLGENNHKAAEEAGATALYSAAIVGVLLSVIGSIYIRPILTLLGATDTILAQATLYGRIIIGGSVFQIINMTTNNLLRSEGASLYSSMGQISGALLNIILDPLFIFVLDMGVTGAAVATVISQGVSSAILLSFYLRGRGVLHPLNPVHFLPRWATYRVLMTLGLPTFVRQVLGGVSFGFLNNAAAVYGDSAIAAASVTLRLFMLLFMGLIGLAQGLQPLAGYNYGAHRYDRVRATIGLVIRLAIGVGAVSGVITFAFAPYIMRIFTPQDPVVIGMGVQAIRFMAVALIPMGLVLMYGGVFQALGDGRSALILATGQQGFFLLPLVVLLPRIFGLPGVFAAHPAGFVLAFLVGVVLQRRTWERLDREEAAHAAVDGASGTPHTEKS